MADGYAKSGTSLIFGLMLLCISREMSQACSLQHLWAGATEEYDWSPNYPNKYPSNIKCEWLIEAISPGHVIKLEIEDSFIEQMPYPNCNGDFVKVFDGADRSAPLLTTFCGSHTPEIISSTRALYMVFITDHAIQTKGFKFSYKAGPPGTFTNTNTLYPIQKDSPKTGTKKTNNVAIIVGVIGGVLCSVLFVAFLCGCLSAKRCPCRNSTNRTVEPVSVASRSHRPIQRTISTSVLTPHLNISMGSIPSVADDIPMRIISPPPYISGPPPSIDYSPTASSPPPPYSFSDPHPEAYLSDSLPSYSAPGEVSRF